MFAAEVGGECLLDINGLRQHPMQLCDHRFRGRTDAVPQQSHGLLLPSFGVDVHVDGTVDALIDHDNGQLTIDASGQDTPQEGVFGSVVLRVVDGEVPQPRPVEHHALNTRADHGLNVLGVQPGSCDELGDSNTGLKQGWSLCDGAVRPQIQGGLVPRETLRFKSIVGECECGHGLPVDGLKGIAA